MKLVLMAVFVLYLSYRYLVRRDGLHLSLFSMMGPPFSNKITMFVFVNIILYFMLITSKLSGNNDRHEQSEEVAPHQSSAILIREEQVSNSSGDDELVEEKDTILVEKYAEEEEEENLVAFSYNLFAMKVGNGDDTGWRPDLIQERVEGLEVVVVETLVGGDQAKEIVCVENELDTLEVDALNRRFDEFIRMHIRTWQLDLRHEQQRLQLPKSEQRS